MVKSLFFLLVFLIASFNSIGQVIINEAMPNNKGVILDENNESSDWVELYNITNDEISLSGWSLSDADEAGEWMFPDITIAAHGYLLVFLSGKDRSVAPYHASFNYSSKEALTLFNNNELVSKIDPVCIPDSVSYGRLEPSLKYGYFKSPTPGVANNIVDTTQIHPLKDTVVFSHQAGYYGEPIELKLTSNYSSNIYYTLDGEEPDESSFAFNGSVTLFNRDAEDDEYTIIHTSPEWRAPETPSAKVNVVRAIVYSHGCPVTDIITSTYFIGDDKRERYKFPVVSLNTNRSSFFGNKKGIYVEGNGEEANYLKSGDEWERDISFEYFVNNQRVINENSSVRIHGRFSRNKPQKSLRLYAEDSTFKYPFFSQKQISEFSRIIIKTVDSHSTTTLFKDEIASVLTQKMNMDVMAWQPVIVFLNGEYWGIHNLRERQDKFYLKNNHNANIDSINIQGISLDGDEDIEGSRKDYDDLISFVEANDITDPIVYNRVLEEIDIENYIDYHITQLYFANYDWPRNNVRFWKEGSNGKWRWMFFDCDVCFINDEYDMLVDYIRGQPKYDDYTFLFRTLLKNNEFRDRFFGRFTYVMNNYFSPDKVVSLIDSCEQLYSPMVNEHIKRWHKPLSYSDWVDNIKIMREFAINRPLEMMNQLNTYLPSPYVIYPNPATGGFYISDNSKQGSSLLIQLVNSQGQVVREYGLQDVSSGVTGSLNVDGLPGGLYFCRFLAGSQFYFSKIIVN